MTVHRGDEPEGSRRATDGLDWGRSSPEPPAQVQPPAAPAVGEAGRPSGPVRPNVYGSVEPAAASVAASSPLPARKGFGTGAVLGIAGASAILAGLVGGGVVAFLTRDGDGTVATGGSAPNTQRVTIEETSAVAEAAIKTRPSVVRIESTITDPGGNERDIGSGVVLDNEGRILTNAHVVLNTDTLKVVLPNGEERVAILLGHDYPFTDLAVLQIGPGGLTPMEIGDSDSLGLGQTVLAIGNPLAEFDGSVTVGVISGLNRVRNIDEVRSDDYIQTDAAVNSGNSGGALVNLEGQFIGMPTAVVRESNGGTPVQGIAFALPSNRVIDIARQIIDGGGSITRPSLEVQHVDLSDAVLSQLPRLSVREGAIVTGITPGGVGAEAGIQPGDVMTSIDGVAIDRDTPLLNALMALTPGQTVKVVLNRQGQIIEADVRLGTR